MKKILFFSFFTGYITTVGRSRIEKRKKYAIVYQVVPDNILTKESENEIGSDVSQ